MEEGRPRERAHGETDEDSHKAVVETHPDERQEEGADDGARTDGGHEEEPVTPHCVTSASYSNTYAHERRA